ncbi:hypothetical protein GRF59_20620 [Paenibacillus sp. HJL G12]|uniref:Polymerase/histidinol phosphatase N-terminal domain-containing protein n=1 Tax=Paenibacillus dendrobii TaxID=2691084 RepID=A0A7X3LID6_9BACL|nr:CehA/McbA family metallohydrolase [Paenibacillus dendrobii]MWV46027.1 hypothetical protein [Paenibacillus dendrobii]
MENQWTLMKPAAEVAAFNVEPGVDWVRFQFEFADPGRWFYINLWDSQGRIRFSHLDYHQVGWITIHRDPLQTSEQAIPGDIPAGEWKIEFVRGLPEAITLKWETGSGDAPFPVAEQPEEWDVWFDGHSPEAHAQGYYTLNRFDWDGPRERKRRWYKGDLHTHTVLSDGDMTTGQITREAEARGLDFFATTEHNILACRWPKSRTLVIPGFEVTSFGKGDWNAIGVKRWLDWRIGAPGGGIDTQQGMDRLMEECGGTGTLRCLNHPLDTPFAWMFMETPLSLLDGFEVMNSPTSSTSSAATEQALVAWNALWNEGYRTTGIGGSDIHAVPPTDEETADGTHARLADPATYVDADELSASAILSAVRAGRVYVSRCAELDIQVKVDGRTYPLGCDLTEAVNQSLKGTVEFTVVVDKMKEGTIHFIENGERVQSSPIRKSGERFELFREWKTTGYRWARLEIRDSAGELIAFTNPVSYGQKDSMIKTWGQLLDQAGIEHPVNKR